MTKIEKQKTQKKCNIKLKLKFEDNKNCLETNHLEKNINYLEKNKLHTDSLKKIIKNS